MHALHPPSAGMAGSARPTSWSLGRSGGDHAFGAAVSDLTPRGPSAEPDSRRVGSPKPIPWRSGPLGSPGPAPVTSRSGSRNSAAWLCAGSEGLIMPFER